jgi:hypothetical protein
MAVADATLATAYKAAVEAILEAAEARCTGFGNENGELRENASLYEVLSAVRHVVQSRNRAR